MKTLARIIAVPVGIFLIANIEAAPVTTIAGVGLIVWAFTGKKP
jgi:hypothetical protein